MIVTRAEMLSYSAEDINSMTKADLLKLAKAEQKSLKDAMRRLRQRGLDTPALKQFSESGNIKARKDMTAGELKHEVMKGQTMLRYKTGTVTQAKQVAKNTLNQLGERFDASGLTVQDSKTFWGIIGKVREENPALLQTPDLNYIPKQIQAIVYDVMTQQKTKYTGKLTPRREANFYRKVTDALISEYEARKSDFDDSEFYEFD